MTHMRSPKILPWIAKRAGISEELALKLWRRAAGEAEYITGKADGSEYWGLAVERFLNLVEDEAGTLPQYGLVPAPRLTWLWQHQNRISMLSLMAAQNAYRFWQNTWETMVVPRKAA